jgi:hypothetical protein
MSLRECPRSMCDEYIQNAHARGRGGQSVKCWCRVRLCRLSWLRHHPDRFLVGSSFGVLNLCEMVRPLSHVEHQK